MKSLYKKAILFWFVLLILALLNATIREMTYKPFLTPYIGIWAHQISSLTAIVLFFIAIFIFLKKIVTDYTRKDVIVIGLLWLVMTFLFENSLSILVRHFSFTEILETYYFWNGETWIFVLLSLVVSPVIIFNILQNNK